jgi:hypothetical protein
VLADGLLVDFLTFFHGTIDPFHLPPVVVKAQQAPAGSKADAWKAGYSEGMKLRVRLIKPVAFILDFKVIKVKRLGSGVWPEWGAGGWAGGPGPRPPPGRMPTARGRSSGWVEVQAGAREGKQRGN